MLQQDYPRHLVDLPAAPARRPTLLGVNLDAWLRVKNKNTRSINLSMQVWMKREGRCIAYAGLATDRRRTHGSPLTGFPDRW